MPGVGVRQAEPAWQEGWRQVLSTALEPEVGRPLRLTFCPAEDLLLAADVPGRYPMTLPLPDCRHLLGSGRIPCADITTGLAMLGRVARWLNHRNFREAVRLGVRARVAAFGPDVVVAHSFGSLVGYDSFQTEPHALEGSVFVSLGSQLGNPWVRARLGLRFVSLPAAFWFHLYNPRDHVFTAPLPIRAPRFRQVRVPFDSKGILNHDALCYLGHPLTLDHVWRPLARLGRAGPTT